MPAFSARNKRFTQYDLMDAAGVFAKNPANVDAMQDAEGNSLYKGPVAFPRMMYHPEGLERVTVEATMLSGPDGTPILDRAGSPIYRNEQKEVIWEIVQDAEQEAALRAAGWHDHPAKAIAAGGRDAPPMGTQQVLDAKDAEIAELRAQLAAGGDSSAWKTKPAALQSLVE